MWRRSEPARGRALAQALAAALIVLSGSYARAQARVGGVREWRLGQPAPIGYHVARKHTAGIVGGSLLAGGYGLSVLYGVALRSECHVPTESTTRPCNAEPLYHAAGFLFIPIVGPFLTLTDHEVQQDGGAIFWFSVFGAMQVAGATLLTYDLAVPHYGLKRGPGPLVGAGSPPRFWVAPTYLGRGPGLVLVGQL